MFREALKISSPLALVSREVPRFHGGSLWHSTPVHQQHARITSSNFYFHFMLNSNTVISKFHLIQSFCEIFARFLFLFHFKIHSSFEHG